MREKAWLQKDYNTKRTNVLQNLFVFWTLINNPETDSWAVSYANRPCEENWEVWRSEGRHFFIHIKKPSADGRNAQGNYRVTHGVRFATRMPRHSWIRAGKELEQDEPTGKLLKVSCNADGIGYEWKPNELYQSAIRVLSQHLCRKKVISQIIRKEGC